MEEEVWKHIDNFINYEVSSFGNVRRVGTNSILKTVKSRGKYHYLNLYNSECRKTFKIHRLVALAFIPNIDNLPTVDHIDRNVDNNNVNNLRWANMVLQSNNRKDKINNSGYKNIIKSQSGKRWVVKKHIIMK